jgi:hypothetical protein
MMNRREREMLDRYITGNYGEDFFAEDEPNELEECRVNGLCGYCTRVRGHTGPHVDQDGVAFTTIPEKP